MVAEPNYAKYGVLVIDDSPVVRAMVSRMLEQLGFGRIQAEIDGSAALAYLETADPAPNLIVCDIGMKPMDGMKFVEALRASPALHLSRLPVIFLTATVTDELVQRARELNANGYIVKPVTPEVLALRVERALA
ncbi:MAG: response regulator [Tagaea sp. CACIAM 22H2]|nr:response regulator [Tagaea sp. CACIAM 22H2]